MHPTILKVLGLYERADHELFLADQSGLIYVSLFPETDTDDGVWAGISFSFDYERDYYYEDVYYDEGYRVVDVLSSDEITDVSNIKWQVDEVDGGNWTPSDADKAIINKLIEDFVFENGDKQLEPFEYEY